MGETSEMFFVSYASEDEKYVRPIWERLRGDFPGVKFWFDRVDIPVGADWDLVIQTAVRSSAGMILVLSANSVEKEGYVQKEFKWAMERTEEMPEGHSFLYWVKLEPCNVPSRMRKWQGCELFGDDTGYHQLKDALQRRLEQLRAKKNDRHPAQPVKRIAFIATERFPLAILEGVYREYTSRNFRRNSGPIPTYGLELENGQAMVLRVDRNDLQYAGLDRQIHLFHPAAIVVLGMGLTQSATPRAVGRLIVPSQIHHYRVQEVTKDGVRVYELARDASPFTPNPRLLSMGLLTGSQPGGVGSISTQLDLAVLRKQIDGTGLEVIELEEGGLFSMVSQYTDDWMLLSAIAGPLSSPSPDLESAGYAASKKVMEVLGLDKQT